MTIKRVLLTALAATTLGALAGAVPAGAQYGRYYDDDDDYRPRRRFERRYDDYDDRPRFRGGFGRRGGGGSLCVTARGNCPYPPRPLNAPCSCDVPGFGVKRGNIGG